MRKIYFAPENIKVIIAHYNEDLSWINDLRSSFQIISKKTIPEETVPNKGREASSYLEYIINNYESLTDISIFIHGHRTSWHNSDVEKYINGKSKFLVEYYNINLISSPRNSEPLWSLNEQAIGFLEKNKYIIEKEINQNINPLNIKYRAASCFYVKKEAILRHKLKSYKNWYEWIMSSKEPSGISSRVFEYCWHIIFTGNHVDNYLEF